MAKDQAQSQTVKAVDLQCQSHNHFHQVYDIKVWPDPDKRADTGNT